MELSYLRDTQERLIQLKVFEFETGNCVGKVSRQGTVEGEVQRLQTAEITQFRRYLT